MNKVVAAAMQPMPAKPAASIEPADAVVTGTVAAHGSIPIPLAKPTI
jgi:hypothetical protein